MDRVKKKNVVRKNGIKRDKKEKFVYIFFLRFAFCALIRLDDERRLRMKFKVKLFQHKKSFAYLNKTIKKKKKNRSSLDVPLILCFWSYTFNEKTNLKLKTTTTTKYLLG